MVLVQILGANNQKFHLNISQLLLYGGRYISTMKIKQKSPGDYQILLTIRTRNNIA